MKTTVYASPPSVETVRAWVHQMDPGIELVFVSSPHELVDNLRRDRMRGAQMSRLVLLESQLVKDTTWELLAGLFDFAGSREGCFVATGFGYMIKHTGGTVDHLEYVCRAAIAMLTVERQNAAFQPRETGRTKAMENQPFWATLKRRHRRW